MLCVLVSLASSASGAPPAAYARPLSEVQVRQQLTRLRNLFAREAFAEGYHECPLPAITLRDTPSFGNYIREKNQIVVASWASLSHKEREDSAQMAAQVGGPATAVSVFEGRTYRWVFVHELGHWWQSCRNQVRPDSFEEENGANRIALAFWRRQDPRFAEGIVQRFEALAHDFPTPIPQGQTLQEYVNANFESISHGDTYTWFQASSIARLAAEDPRPSFHKALSQPLYPL
jgi:hypothetical protein